MILPGTIVTLAPSGVANSTLRLTPEGVYVFEGKVNTIFKSLKIILLLAASVVQSEAQIPY